MARRRGRELDTREALLQTAQELFLERGYDAASVGLIVARAGLSKGTFFHWFSSKDELLDRVVDRMADRAWEELRPVLESDRPAAERLTGFLAASLRWKEQHLDAMPEIASTLRYRENALLFQRMRARDLERVTPGLTRVIAEGVEQGDFRVDDPEETARILVQLLGAAAEANMSLAFEARDPGEIAEALGRRMNAVMTALERILGSAEGLLPRVPRDTLLLVVQALRAHDHEDDAPTPKDGGRP